MAESTHYGVFWAPGRIAFLHQDGPGQNAVGLGQPSPFTVSPRLPPCPHQIQLNMEAPRDRLPAFREILERSAMARFLVPVPPHHEPTVRWLPVASPTPVLPELAQFLRMSSPRQTPIEWWWAVKGNSNRLGWSYTNLTPLVIGGVGLSEHSLACAYAQAALYLPRRVLLMVSEDFPLPPRAHSLEWEEHDLEALTSLPWEAFGATVVRAYMRRNWDQDTSWFLDEGEILDA